MDINKFFSNIIIEQLEEGKKYKKMWKHFKKLKFDNQTINILMNELERQYLSEPINKTIIIEIEDDNYTKLVKGEIKRIGRFLPEVITIKEND